MDIDNINHQLGAANISQIEGLGSTRRPRIAKGMAQRLSAGRSMDA